MLKLPNCDVIDHLYAAEVLGLQRNEVALSPQVFDLSQVFIVLLK